jgi:hypothetical protein
MRRPRGRLWTRSAEITAYKPIPGTYPHDAQLDYFPNADDPGLIGSVNTRAFCVLIRVISRWAYTLS